MCHGSSPLLWNKDKKGPRFSPTPGIWRLQPRHRALHLGHEAVEEVACERREHGMHCREAPGWTRQQRRLCGVQDAKNLAYTACLPMVGCNGSSRVTVHEAPLKQMIPAEPSSPTCALRKQVQYRSSTEAGALKKHGLILPQSRKSQKIQAPSKVTIRIAKPSLQTWPVLPRTHTHDTGLNMAL